MSKVALWKRKAEEYYGNITKKQFKEDIEKAGFKTCNSTLRNIPTRIHNYAYNEIACTLDTSSSSEENNPLILRF